MISVSGFSKHFDGFAAVDGLSFNVAPGEILGLVGPNGAGKTTTLRALVGILPPTQGQLRIGGYDIVKDPIPAKRLLAYLPDEPKLFDSLTVWEHLEFTGAVYNVDNFHAAAERLLERFELVPHRDKLAEELSRGLRQRTALACAYLHQPQAICFDEPLVGLDPRGIRTLKESIRERAEGGAAVILSSHMLDLVEGLCTRLLILHKGRAVFFGSLEEARAQVQEGEAGARLEDVFFRITEAG